MSLAFARIWIIVAAFLVVDGWLLSAIHQLNRTGYLVSFLVAIAMGFQLFRRHIPGRIQWRWSRFRRWLPLSYFALSLLIVLSGVLYAPNNYDALSYRIPRVLHWLAEGHWHWIHTGYSKLNTRATDCEWIMAPLILFGRSERWAWLPNAAMFMLLPGLIYSTYVRVGIRKKVAWHWMWILPTGYVFILQAGGLSNDLPGAFMSLAAVCFALRAGSDGSTLDLALSILAIALSQGMKASNAPLALPWAFAVWPALKLIRFRQALLMIPVLVTAALISYLPTAILNQRHCGDWSGSKLELGDLSKAPTWVLVSGNAVSLTVQNFTPPVFPTSNWWNAKIPALFPASYKARLAESFEAGGIPWWTTDMQIEDMAPLGLGVSALLLVAAAAALFSKSKKPRRFSTWINGLHFAPWLALLVFMAKVGLLNSGRLIAPYYLLLPLPILRSAAQQVILDRKWWPVLVKLNLLGAFLLLVISPSRPLWPALTILEKVTATHPGQKSLEHLAKAYATYRHRSDALAPVRHALPSGATTVGLIGEDDLETSLWRPFGARRLIHIVRGDSRETLRAKGIRYIVVDSSEFENQFQKPLSQWKSEVGADQVAAVSVETRASKGPSEWDLLQLRVDGG